MRTSSRYFVFFVVFMTLSSAVLAQGYYNIAQTEFGQNRIQIRKLDWRTITSNNFEFNYYRGGEKMANFAAKVAEQEYRNITEILGYTPFTTMKVFLYNNFNQIAQSNIGLTSPILYDGGILNLSRSRIEIPYPGNDSLFRLELVKQISGLFVYDMLYGGSLKEVLQSSLLLTVPEWYLSGISAYIARDGMAPEEYPAVIEAINRNADKKLSNITGKDAELIGQSIWNYIALRYGRDNISNILNLTRIIRTEQSSITSTLGLTYNKFQADWRSFYLNGKFNSVEKKPEPTAEPEEVNVLDKRPPLKGLTDGRIDTEHYEFNETSLSKFSEQQKTEVLEQTSTFNRSRLYGKSEELKISAPKVYENLLLAQDLKTEIYNDPIRRIGLNNSMIINDVLENHIFKFELFLTPTLKNHDLGLSYQNYEKRLDWGLFFKRRSIHLDKVSEKQYYIFRPLKILLPELSMNRRIFQHVVGANLSYPLSPHFRIRFAPQLSFNNDIDYYDLGNKILNSSFGALHSEAIFDNTRYQSETGFSTGTRGILSYQKYLGISETSNNFNRLNLDLRHYQGLLPGLMAAARFNYGRSTGPSPKYSFIGGMENTINRTVHPDEGLIPGEPGDLRDIVFYNYPGNLRGFDFGKLFGTNYMLFNLELRVALSRYFPKNAVTSGFLKNLQIVAFNDIGTAWNGNKGPWSRQNSLNTREIGDGNPFYAVVTNFNNPFLIGYGAGIRTSLLGFTVKADYGFGLENKEVNGGKLYLSVGKDF